MSILVQNITKLYVTQKALDAVSFEIAPGEVVGLLGPNGAGKSTLMKILTCFIPATSGSASVCNFDVAEQSIEVRKKIGYLPENNPLYLDLYVKEFLEFVAGIRRTMHGTRYTAKESEKPLTEHRVPSTKHRAPSTKNRIAEIISLTGLGEEQHKKIGALSRGYRQRVGLAQALLHDPEVLILDEPTSGLDPNQIVEIRSLIKKIGEEKTIMMSTHIMQEVEAVCDRAIIIHKGKIVADDSTKNLRNIASERTIIRVEFSTPIESAQLLKIPGVVETYPTDAVADHTASSTRNPSSRKWRLIAGISSDIRADVFRFAVDNNLTVLSLQQEEHKLEEVFQELTRN